MVSSTDLVLHVIALLDKLAIPYMLVGSFSSNYYGRPRSTKDADFVVVISEQQVNSLRTGLLPDFHLDTQMSFETVTMHTRYVIAHHATAFKIELFMLADDAFSHERFKRRHQVDFEGHQAWLPTAEDVVVQKLLWGETARRAKDIEDVRQILRLQKDKLDMVYIRSWCGKHDSLHLLEELLGT